MGTETTPAAFDRQPTLVGDLVELRPLRPGDFDDLFAAASDPLIWAQHPDPSRSEPEGFRRFFDQALASGGTLVIVDRATGRVIGSSRYHGHDPERREIEIGWTFLARSHWGGTVNGEVKRLMLDHAFRFVDAVLFLIGLTNFRSQRAAEKIGAVRVGTRADTHGNDSYVYRITPATRAHGRRD